MSLFTRFSAYRFLVFGSFAILVLSSPLRAQTDSMAKWKPNVGDRFTYLYHEETDQYSHGREVGSTNSGYYLTYVIIKTDSNFDSTHSSVVVAVNGTDTTLYSYQLSHDSTSPLPIIIETGPSFSSVYDFSNSKSFKLPFSQDTLTFYYDSVAHISYSPDLRWFLYSDGNSTSGDPGPLGNYTVTTWEYYLDSVTTAGVSSPVASIGNEFIRTAEENNNLLLIDVVSGKSFHPNFQLLDLLGRPIRSWQLPVDAGERQITLNVADVPSGVYFLRVSAPGVEEIRKVVIVH